MDASVKKLIGVSGGAFFAMNELLQSKHSTRTNNEKPLDPYTLQNILSSELGNIPFSEKYAKRDAHPNGLSGDTFEMASAAIERLAQEDISDVIANAFTWVNNYQLSEEAAAHLDKSVLDCNDSSRMTCDQLSKHGFPMYLLSICPSNMRNFFKYDWHQMATCRMGREYYLIINNGTRATLWHGTLGEFVAQRDSEVPMCIFPLVGISRYREPKYDIAPSKFLLQLAHAQSEEEMEILSISAPIDPNTQLVQLSLRQDYS